MKLLSLQDPSSHQPRPPHYRLAVRTERGVVGTAGAPEPVPQTVMALLYGGAEARAALEAFVLKTFVNEASEFLDEAALTLGPCVPTPGKIICVGLNYRRHAAEAGMDVPKTPILFSKYANTLAGSEAVITIPKVTKQVDYEAELAVVIGRHAKNVGEDEAQDYVFGYCNGNDLSARDLQMLTGQWLLGKTLDGFLPLGPYLVTADEVGDPDALQLRCWLNGELRQDSSTADMVFSTGQLVSYISHHMSLESGDVILTGTPEGVIFGDSPAVWLKAGDEVTVETEKLGRLSNTFQAEP